MPSVSAGVIKRFRLRSDRRLINRFYFFYKTLGTVLLRLKSMGYQEMFGRPGSTDLGVFILQLEAILITF